MIYLALSSTCMHMLLHGVVKFPDDKHVHTFHPVKNLSDQNTNDP